jgi:hypothetical protein
VAGITSYRLDVSEDGFATLVPGYDNMPVLATTQAVTGLSSGITYRYRVRAVNATSPSANSNSITIATLPEVPVSSAATSITTTGFTINWSAVTGATSYSIDLSLDNFTTYVTGYNGKVVANAIPVIVTGLTQNTNYSYRVRATNSSGSSGISAVINVLTYPDAPVATAATSATQTGFTANWQAVAGITEYRLDVSNDDFATYLAGFDNLSVTSGIAKAVPALTAGATYKYRVRAINATGPSAQSNVISIITLPGTPLLPTPTGVTTTAFTITWTAVAGADSYLLDVATAATFSSNSMLAGYSAKSVSATSEALTGLTPGTVYHYRLKARNATGESAFSPAGSQITLPLAPIPSSATEIGASSFKANWSAVQGADHYELDVTLLSSNFATFVPGYQSRIVPDGETEDIVTGLNGGTSYYFRVRAVNAAGKSANSQRKGVTTTGATSVFSVAINTPTNAEFSGTAINVPGSVSNATGDIVAVTLFHRGITSDAFNQKPLTLSGGSYTVVIEDSMLDEIGVEFYVSVEDESGAIINTQKQRIYRAVSANAPILSGTSAGTRASIRIIAIPYELSDNDIVDIFVSLGQYDKKRWRLAHYQDGANVEYQNGLLKVERGLGYWFNAAGSVDVKAGPGKIPPNNSDTPFALSLAQGWNQIGNPYPFPIDWSDVLADNPTVSGVGDLFLYDGTVENFKEEDVLPELTGGFVRADQATTINFKVSLKGTAGGRKSHNWKYDIGEDTWMLPLSLTQEQSTYDLTAIGMTPDAMVGKDQWDELRLPRLDEYLDITFDHPGEKSRYFTRDIVATADKAAWRFVVESSGPNENGTLRWDNTRFGDNIAQVFLLDVDAMDMIDMRLVDNYTFLNPVKKEFRIYYSRNGEPIAPDLLGMGHPYPNPSSDAVSVVIALPDTQKEFTTELIAYDMMGKPIKTVNFTLSPGIHEVTWDGTESSGNRVYGVHILRARVSNNLLPNSFRVVMK